MLDKNTRKLEDYTNTHTHTFSHTIYCSPKSETNCTNEHKECYKNIIEKNFSNM